MTHRILPWLLVGCLWIAGSATAQTIPTNVLLNNDGTPFLQNEEQIWISRTDSLRVIANWRDWRLGFRRVGFAVSTDAGVTWGIDSLAVGLYSRQSDPCLTGDRLGHFYMNMLDYNPGDQSTISIMRSTDGGTSWGSPIAATPLGPYFEDKQFTTTDRTGGLHDGNYYMSWTRFPNSGPAVMMFVRSTNGAQSFLPPVVVGPPLLTSCGTIGAGQGSIPVVNSDGSVHVFWSGYDTTDICQGGIGNDDYAICHALSTTGGAFFGGHQVAFPSNAFFEVLPGSGVDVYGFPIADADLSGGSRDGTIYIAHTQYASGFSGETDIQLRKSTDNGATWSDPVLIHDDPPGQGADQFHPWLTVNQEGVLFLLFYDERTDPAHLQFDCFFTASFDGGETFTQNLRISEVSINPSNLESAQRSAPPPFQSDFQDPVMPVQSIMAGKIAEYIGIHAYYDHAVAIWTDTRNGNQDAYSAQFDLPFLAPVLHEPAFGTVTTESQPQFLWSTAWHALQDSYRLELSSDSLFAVLDYEFGGLSNNTFTPPAPLATGHYYWRVKGFRTAGDSTQYSAVFRLDPSCQPAAPPEQLEPTANDSLDTDTLTLIWSAEFEVVGYDLQLDSLASFASPVLDTSLTDTVLVQSGLPDSLTFYWRVRTTGTCGTGTWNTSSFYRGVCPIQATGDVNVDGTITSADIIELVNFTFKSGPAPLPVKEAGDVDCSGEVSSADIIFLVNFVFKSGPSPCDACSLL